MASNTYQFAIRLQNDPRWFPDRIDFNSCDLSNASIRSACTDYKSDREYGLIWNQLASNGLLAQAFFWDRNHLGSFTLISSPGENYETNPYSPLSEIRSVWGQTRLRGP